MPIHDWSRVEAGIFHDFHHAWIEQIKRILNGGLLPPDYYALAEQQAGKFGPDILTLKSEPGETIATDGPASDSGSLRLAKPKLRYVVESDLEYYRRKQSSVAIRHISDDSLVAVIEIVSGGNKSGRAALAKFIAKAAEFFDRDIHLMVLDLQPPSRLDPRGIHSAIWEEVTGREFIPPADKPLTLVSYEVDLVVTAYIEPVAVGDTPPDMPLFLLPGKHVPVPLEATYRSAWEGVPLRWRRVIETPPA